MDGAMWTKKLGLTAIALLIAQPVLADPGGKPHQGRGAEQNESALAGALISAAERSAIIGYFREAPPADAGDGLPPGIRKKLARGKPLPPGIARKMPDPLMARLPPHSGYAYQMVGPDVVLIEMATGLIADMVRDAIR